MKEKSLINITPAQFRAMFPDAPCVGFGDDFYVLDARLKGYHNPQSHPCRIDGFMLFYCMNGSLDINLNLSEMQISQGMVLINVPDRKSVV